MREGSREMGWLVRLPAEWKVEQVKSGGGKSGRRGEIAPKVVTDFLTVVLELLYF